MDNKWKIELDEATYTFVQDKTDQLTAELVNVITSFVNGRVLSLQAEMEDIIDEYVDGVSAKEIKEIRDSRIIEFEIEARSLIEDATKDL